ncbi:MAG: TlpA family protein disulfide reductase, partial [Bdellovibrionales bacterium]|nr:TlpA family protein disulfide reductase [Bdellovibrionales bacterium]
PDAAVESPSGNKVQISELRGKITLVSFWATWCGPCQVELPTLKKLDEKYHDQGLRIVAVNVDEMNTSSEFVSHFWGKMNLPFQYVRDTSGEAMSNFGVEVLPSNFILDSGGHIAVEAHGANDWSHPTSTKLIEDLLLQLNQTAKK